MIYNIIILIVFARFNGDRSTGPLGVGWIIIGATPVNQHRRRNDLFKGARGDDVHAYTHAQ